MDEETELVDQTQPEPFRKVGIYYSRQARARYDTKYYGGTCCIGYIDEYRELTENIDMLETGGIRWPCIICCLCSLGMCGTGLCSEYYLYRGEVVSFNQGQQLYQEESDEQKAIIQNQQGCCSVLDNQTYVQPPPMIPAPLPAIPQMSIKERKRLIREANGIYGTNRYQPGWYEKLRYLEACGVHGYDGTEDGY